MDTGNANFRSLSDFAIAPLPDRFGIYLEGGSITGLYYFNLRDALVVFWGGVSFSLFGNRAYFVRRGLILSVRAASIRGPFSFVINFAIVVFSISNNYHLSTNNFQSKT